MFVCRNDNLILSLIMTYRRVCKNSNTTGYTGGAELELPTIPEHQISPPVLVEFVLLNINFTA